MKIDKPMNIIIPLGGIGKRFSDNGYTKPKPLIKVIGKEIIFWLLDSLKLQDSDNVYIPYNEYLDGYQFKEVVNSVYPNIKLTSLPTTNGPSETIKLCINHFNIKGKVVLLDGDTWYGEDILSKIRQNGNNLTTYFKSTTLEPLFSYIKLNDNQIVDVKEKVKISDNANSGCYVFKSSEQILEYIDRIETNSEKFTSDIIKEMLKDEIYFSAVEVNDFHVLGTPQQIIEFSKSYPIETKRFVFDLDNTLVTFPTIAGDYTSVKPISKTINYLRNLKKDGHHIIIYTARRMRTHGGNVGAIIADIGAITMNTLKEFDIPYDELFFGKPYAHFYIDDLMINPKTDLNKELGFYMEDVEPRHFNKLIYDSETVTKLSSNDKLEGESYYYKEIEKYPIRKYFPKLIFAGKGKVIMEKFDGSNFSTLYINEILTTEHIDLLLSTIGEIHSSDSNGPISQYYDYNEKLMNRFDSFDYIKYGLSNEEFFDIKQNVESLRGEYKIIHGDLVFSNIILTNTGKIKLIDVKGKQGNDFSIFGDCFYDYAKIYQSLIGYDEILLDKEIKESYKSKMINYFNSKFSNQDLEKIRNITKSLLVSLIPLHNEANKFKKYINLAKK
jgi:capsule biosynthesis phosphatase|tara:strand:+ start:38 stop:1870 length:1833 start_codon:yes stop_codon:yes gene_type:complete